MMYQQYLLMSNLPLFRKKKKIQSKSDLTKPFESNLPAI